MMFRFSNMRIQSLESANMTLYQSHIVYWQQKILLCKKLHVTAITFCMNPNKFLTLKPPKVHEGASNLQ